MLKMLQHFLNYNYYSVLKQLELWHDAKEVIMVKEVDLNCSYKLTKWR